MRRTDKLWNGYVLIQDDDFFKLGQDSMLLSDFAAPPMKGEVLDLGCGNGALSVLLCARHEKLHVTGLELQADVAQLARENAQVNRLQDRFTVKVGDFKQYKQLYPTGSFSYVVCNPPYFANQSGAAAKGQNRSTARQEQQGSMADAVKAAAYFVKFGGRVAFVYRPERVCELIAHMLACDLQPKRMRFVHQTAQSAPSAVLVEARRGSAPGVQVMPPLLVCQPNGTKTEEYRKIYHMEEFSK